MTATIIEVENGYILMIGRTLPYGVSIADCGSGGETYIFPDHVNLGDWIAQHGITSLRKEIDACKRSET